MAMRNQITKKIARRRTTKDQKISKYAAKICARQLDRQKQEEGGS
jgi:hypothetical protein